MSLKSLFITPDDGSACETEDMVGSRFHRWLVVGPHKRINAANYVGALCDCGTRRDVLEYSLRTGASKSCGCYSVDVSREIGKRAKTHGMTSTDIYNIWGGMIARCHNPKGKSFDKYGGRGITVCDRWRYSFENFYADMGPRPQGTSIDRIDNDKGYSPDNCRWATPTEQARNSSAATQVTIGGRTQCIAAWLEEFSLNKITYLGRRQRGWSPERALTTPTDQRFNWRRAAS